MLFVIGLTYYRMATTQYGQVMSALKSTSGGLLYAEWMLMNVLVDLACTVVGFASSTELLVRNHIRTFCLGTLLTPSSTPPGCHSVVPLTLPSPSPSVLSITVTPLIITLTPVLIPASPVGSQNLLHDLTLSNSTLAQQMLLSHILQSRLELRIEAHDLLLELGC